MSTREILLCGVCINSMEYSLSAERDSWILRTIVLLRPLVYRDRHPALWPLYGCIAREKYFRVRATAVTMLNF